ncbi:hypothetical protein BS47DRAFT_243890 [Hydnum rufescens UP504]|uniref:Uncharacterized protein n=1 Tax=Hydnum rufescens UP504 TaxID=1448309 RepID=A0A9P6DMQ8_9AGAM|nr:hypothetical protein BS47DRAFT_243890 [Hydnum rufescens UP504]
MVPTSMRNYTRPLPFAVDIDPADPMDRESTDHVSPGAYLIVKDETNSIPPVFIRMLDSKRLSIFPTARDQYTSLINPRQFLLQYNWSTTQRRKYKCGTYYSGSKHGNQR